MFARLGAKAVFLTMLLALVFSGVLMLPLAIAAVLAPYVGQPLAYIITGVIVLVPPILWAAAVSMTEPVEPPPPTGVLGMMLTALGQRAPWGFIVTGAVSGAVEAYLNRNRRRK